MVHLEINNDAVANDWLHIYYIFVVLNKIAHPIKINAHSSFF